MQTGDPPAIRLAAQDDEDELLASLVLAFISDPLLRWLYPSPRDYLDHGSVFLGMLGHQAYEHGTAYCFANRRGVALWLPPGVEPDMVPILELFERTLPEEKHEEILVSFELLETFEPTDPHLVLRVIGIDPVYQDRGHGTGLLEPVLVECDETGVSVFLKSTNSRNLSFYERHGFEVLEKVQVSNVPPFYPMLREPQP